MQQYSLLFIVVVTMISFFLFESIQAHADTPADKKQAVCNVSPTPAGAYEEEGCKTAFNALPAGTLCAVGETAKVGICTVNSDACTNSASRTGKWCTCTYTCEKKAATALE
ncbi:MAG TPA: hypothetical protein VJH37_03450 [Candidatus Nanoarchaeia archaeon]|nr:hypothetical protein [Candidatus Nanoarchaeia archaeon]